MIDAVTSATRYSFKEIKANWDFTDFNNNKVDPGIYNYCIEYTNTDEPGPFIIGSVIIGTKNKLQNKIQTEKHGGREYISHIKISFKNLIKKIKIKNKKPGDINPED